MVGVVWMVQLVSDSFPTVRLIVVDVIDAVTTVSCWLLNYLFEFLAPQHLRELILLLTVEVEVTTDDCWSLHINSLFHYFHKLLEGKLWLVACTIDCDQVKDIEGELKALVGVHVNFCWPLCHFICQFIFCKDSHPSAVPIANKLAFVSVQYWCHCLSYFLKAYDVTILIDGTVLFQV